MDTNKMREQASKEFEAFYADYEKRREANGWMPLETHVVVHMRSAWLASRKAVVVELPERDAELCDYSLGFNACLKKSREAIEAHGVKCK